MHIELDYMELAFIIAFFNYHHCLAANMTLVIPSLDVVAVSQAPSPESNPNPPLPVKATVVQYTTVKADRAET